MPLEVKKYLYQQVPWIIALPLYPVENQVEERLLGFGLGDSTMASDGIIKDVRNRMFDEFVMRPVFGHVDPRWSCVVIFIENHLEDGVQVPLLRWFCFDNYGLAGTVSVQAQMPILFWTKRRWSSR